MTLGPASDASDEIAGLAWSTVEEVQAESIRRSVPRPADEAVACPACGRLCSRVEAADHVCDRLEFSVN